MEQPVSSVQLRVQTDAAPVPFSESASPAFRLRSSLLFMMAAPTLCACLLVVLARGSAIAAHPWSSSDPFPAYDAYLPGQANALMLPATCLQSSVVADIGAYYMCDAGDMARRITVLMQAGGVTHVEFHSDRLLLAHLINHWGYPDLMRRSSDGSHRLWWHTPTYTVHAMVSDLSGTTLVPLVEVSATR